MTTPVAGLAIQPYAAEPSRLGRIVLVVVVSLVCAVGAVGVVLLASLGSGDTRGAALTLLFATIPVPVVISFFMWLDRYEPEPLLYLVAAVAWGGVIATALALAVEFLFARGAHVSDATMATVVAPLTEEPAKALFLVVIAIRRRRELTGITDGLVYAGLVGIGFAFTENVGYYATGYAGRLSDQISGPGAATGLFVVRGLFSPFAHSLFACAFGIGVGVAVTTRRRWLKVAAPVVGLAGSMGLHALWNGSGILGGPKYFLLVYAFMFVPIFLGFVGLAAWVRQREGRVLIRALDDAALRGWLHPDEVPWLSRFGLRRIAQRNARLVSGKPTAAALRRYQSLAAAMAFAHDRVMRGRVGPNGRVRVAERLHEMALVRPYIVLPPPLRLLTAPPPWPVHPGGGGTTSPPPWTAAYPGRPPHVDQPPDGTAPAQPAPPPVRRP